MQTTAPERSKELDAYYPLLTPELIAGIEARLADMKVPAQLQERKYFDFSSPESRDESPARSADHFHYDRFNHGVRVVLSNSEEVYLLASQPRSTWMRYWEDGSELNGRTFGVYSKGPGASTQAVNIWVGETDFEKAVSTFIGRVSEVLKLSSSSFPPH